MTNNAFIVGGSYSIAIAAVIGLVRLPKLYAAYQPFIILTIISFINEVVSHCLIVNQKSNAVAVNIFGLFDAMLWLWQFSKWNNPHKRRLLFHITAAVLVALWLFENIVLKKLFVFGSIYPITFSLVMVIISAVEATRQIAKQKESLLRRPEFLICCCAVLFYTYRILIECFYAPGFKGSEIFFGNLFAILSCVNFIVNLFYALIVLWIPEKQKFSLPSY